ncbi:MAG: Stk1 family PASTA domain-containing Ser/Thr kinase, partial [Lachnospiraceae bacterium]|nr:Stk1 family PASTA domain-containing Ser/Thr kinase [Lachnospiraceae bacterium]
MIKAGVILAGRYEIVGRIGSGGMADVYKAMDKKLNRFVAVKVMKPEFQSDSTFISKFRREAQAAAGLANPNIVNVYDVGEDQGNYYIVMELVEGITLKEYIVKKGRLSVREATSIAIQVGMGLAAAHDQGIVHRDVKPQNIIISTDGKVKVTDFGIARAASSNTISANAMGSVHYSSPEQVRGGYSDARSDIYSLGITLYEMVTGRVPFDGESTVAIAIKHLQDEMEKPSRYTPDLPFSLEQIIIKCTQKSVERRYQSMNDVITDLKRSLMEPDGDFVQIASLTDYSRTVLISSDDQAAIKKTLSGSGSDAPEEEQVFSSVQAARLGRADKPQGEDGEEHEEEDEGESEGSGLEKIVTIGSFVVCGLIVAVLIYFIGRAAGLFGRTTPPASSTVQVVETASTSSGAESVAAITVEVPNLIGMTESDAARTAEAKRLTVKFMGEKSSDKAAGTVIEQDPKGGRTVNENTEIAYYRSSGPTKIAIPEVTGAALADAQAALAAAGFSNITTQNEHSETVARGNVISITPAAGEEAVAAAEITLVVSEGTANVEQVTVPDYRGSSLEYSQSNAESLGLEVTLSYDVSDRVAEDEVIRQSPQPGEVVPQYTELILTINNEAKMQEAASADGAGEVIAEEPETQTQAQESEAAPAEMPAQSWSTTANLGEPDNYTQGAYRLELVQNVDGQDVATV